MPAALRLVPSAAPSSPALAPVRPDGVVARERSAVQRTLRQAARVRKPLAPKQAIAALRRSARRLRALGAPVDAAEALLAMGQVARTHGDWPVARKAAKDAIAIADTVGNDDLLDRARQALALAQHALGASADAAALYASLDQAPSRFGLLAGLAWLEIGELARAEDACAAAGAHLEAEGDVAGAGCAEALVALVLAERGESSLAQEAREEAELLVADVADGAARVVVGMAAEILEGTPVEPATAPRMRATDESPALAIAAGRLAAWSATRTGDLLEIWSGGFRHDGQSVDCARFAAVTRMLDALAAARLERPGEAVSTAELRDAAWPGERMAEASAHNRLHVALSKLRKMGLKGILVRKGDGYLLDPALPVVRAAGPRG